MPVSRVLYTKQSEEKRFLIQDAAMNLAFSMVTVANDNTHPRAAEILGRPLSTAVGPIAAKSYQGSFRSRVRIVTVVRAGCAGQERRRVGS